MVSRRESIPDSVEVVRDQEERAKLEAKNGLKQFDAVQDAVMYWLDRVDDFRLRPSLIQNFQRVALQGLSHNAGTWRASGVKIAGSSHNPPEAFLVPELIEQMTDYINDHWQIKTPIHLSAYAMWRLNWIHPFDDGNGRTSRALSYFILSIGMKSRLPGTLTIPQQIEKSRKDYYECLEDADMHFENGEINLEKIEEMIEAMLAEQLFSAIQHATSSEMSTE